MVVVDCVPHIFDGLSVVGSPRALILAVGSQYLLLHSSIVCVYWPLLGSTLFKSLCLFLESLSVMLVCLDELNFFLVSLYIRVGWRLDCLLLLIWKIELFLSNSMSIRGLQRRSHGIDLVNIIDWVHTKLHKVWLTQGRVPLSSHGGMSVLGCKISILMGDSRRSSTITQMDLRRLLDYSFHSSRLRSYLLLLLLVLILVHL